MPSLRDQVRRLDAEARSVLELAAQVCVQRTHFEIGLPHLLVALVEGSLPVREALWEAGVDPFAVSRKVQQRLGLLVGGYDRVPPLRPEVVRVVVEATEGRCSGVGSLDLLQAMLRVPDLRLLAGELAEELTAVPVGLHREQDEPGVEQTEQADNGPASPAPPPREPASELAHPASEGAGMAAGIGTLVFRRPTGDEVFPLQSATLMVTRHATEVELLLSVRAERRAEGRRVLSNAEVSVFLPDFDPAGLPGRRFEVPQSYDEEREDHVSCVYCYEHKDLNRNVVEVLGREGGCFRVRWTGTTESDSYDGSEPESRVVIEGLFELVGA